jgi:arylsulfatase A-like enzyme
VDQNWKLMANKDMTHFELYDIAADPMEKTDLAAAKAEVASGLIDRIKAWQETLPEKPSGNVFSKERSGL